MRYCDSIFGHLLKPISRRWFAGVVARHDADAYDKAFRSWDHLTLLVFAQLGGIESLRGLEAAWNANAHHHYHLGVDEISRSTISDANARRPFAVFSETFAMVSRLAGRKSRREGEAMLSLIDSSPIPLGPGHRLGEVERRIRGLEAVCGLRTGLVTIRPTSTSPTPTSTTWRSASNFIKLGFTHVFDKLIANTAGGQRFMARPRQLSSPARRRPPDSARSPGASSRNAAATASRSSTMPKSNLSARVIPGFSHAAHPRERSLQQ